VKPPASTPLPAGPSDPRERGRAIFDQFANLYDYARPGYPAAVFTTLTVCCGLVPDSRVLEIGCGTGQATRELAQSGAAIRCLEPGAALARLARKNLAALPNVTVGATTFEGADEQPASYDIVFSATAFHWIDPHVSFAKAARLLRPGGWIALLTNAHSAGGTDTEEPIAGAITELHRRLVPEIGDWTFPSADQIHEQATAGGDLGAVWARVEPKLGEAPAVDHLFEPPMIFTYPWLASYDRDRYLAMLASQSSYALLAPRKRETLLRAIGQLVDDRLEGAITKRCVSVLAIAKRPRTAAATVR
jgi:SAM-dependent methyltransferase